MGKHQEPQYHCTRTGTGETFMMFFNETCHNVEISFLSHFYCNNIIGTSFSRHVRKFTIVSFICFLPSFMLEIYQTICFVFWVKNVKKLFTFCFYLLFVFFKICCSVKAVKLRGAFWHSSINFQEIINHMSRNASYLKFWVNKVNII